MWIIYRVFIYFEVYSKLLCTENVANVGQKWCNAIPSSLWCFEILTRLTRFSLLFSFHLLLVLLLCQWIFVWLECPFVRTSRELMQGETQEWPNLNKMNITLNINKFPNILSHNLFNVVCRNSLMCVCWMKSNKMKWTNWRA